MFADLILIVLLVTVGGIGVAVTIRMVNAYKKPTELKFQEVPWTLVERFETVDNKRCRVVSVWHPGETAERVGAVPWGDPDFDDKIATVRSEAEYRLAVLNQSVKRLKK